MNKINAATRDKEAAFQEAEAEKIKIVKNVLIIAVYYTIVKVKSKSPICKKCGFQFVIHILSAEPNKVKHSLRDTKARHQLSQK